MINIAFIEDDAAYRKALTAAVQLQPDVLVVAQNAGVEEFLAELPKRARIDLLFLDIDLPGISGVDALGILRRRLAETDIVMLTRFEDSEKLMKAINRGASGYLLKDFPVVHLPKYIQIFQSDGALLSPIMARKLISYLNPPLTMDEEGAVSLGPKEEQVLRLLSEGNTYQEVAELMKMSINAVRYYIKSIYRKFDVTRRHDAIRKWKGE